MPYISKQDSWTRAEEFRREYLPLERQELPLDIFDVIERDLNMSLVPEPGLEDKRGYGAYISTDLSEIAIDQNQFMANDGTPGRRRARLSAAIEIGHLVLHRNIIESFQQTTGNHWKRYARRVYTPGPYDRLYIQALEFAGRLLVPRDDLTRAVSSHVNDMLKESDFLSLSTDEQAGIIAPLILDIFDLNYQTIMGRIRSESILPDLLDQNTS